MNKCCFQMKQKHVREFSHECFQYRSIGSQKWKDLHKQINGLAEWRKELISKGSGGVIKGEIGNVCVLVRVPVAVKRHNNPSNVYKGQHLVG